MERQESLAIEMRDAAEAVGPPLIYINNNTLNEML